MSGTKRPSPVLAHREPVFGLSTTPSQWVVWMVSSYNDLGIDTFVLWPAEGDEEGQLRLFTERVVPKIRASLAEKTIKPPAT